MLLMDDEKSRRKMFKFLIRHLLIGLAIGWSLMTAIFIFDLAGLRTLARINHMEYVVYPLLYLFVGITFASASIGLGVMGMNKEDDDDDDGGMKLNITPNNAKLAPIKIAARRN